MEKVDNLEDLIYDLIFSENTEYKIDICNYITNIYKYDRFIDDTKKILRKSKVSIVKEKLTVEIDSVTWEIKVKK